MRRIGRGSRGLAKPRRVWLTNSRPGRPARRHVSSTDQTESHACVDLFPQIVHQRFEDQRHIEPPLHVVIGQDAAVGEDEDVLGLETLGQRDRGPAVGGVGAGGCQAGGLPEDAAEEPGQLADQQAGPAPLVDRFLARLLDVGLQRGEPGRADRSRARRPPRRSMTGETARARRRPVRWRG